jgi:hypothetical protein
MSVVEPPLFVSATFFGAQTRELGADFSLIV